MADEKANQNQNQNQNCRLPTQPRPVLDAFSRLPSVGLIFLAFNTAVAVYRARDNPWLVAFVVTSYLDLLLLFYCLHLHETAPRNSPRRRHLRTAVSFLASFLIVTFSCGVEDMVLAVLVWCAAAPTVGLGFFWFFIYTPDSYTPTDLAHPRPVLDAFSSLPSAVLIFLAFNTAVAVYLAMDYPWLVAFVVTSYLHLLLLFYCLHLHETAPRNSPRRRHLRTAVWFLASFLIVMFSYGVEDMVFAVLVWCAAALTVGLGFYRFFIYPPDSSTPTDLKDDICDML